MRLSQELTRLARHSVIYGLGGLVSRILAVLLLPLYTSYLAPGSYGHVEILTSACAVAVIVLRMGVSTAFFRFYFDHKDAARRLVVVRTSFWFTMAMATAGLVLCVGFAGPLSHALQLGDNASLSTADPCDPQQSAGFTRKHLKKPGKLSAFIGGSYATGRGGFVFITSGSRT